MLPLESQQYLDQGDMTVSYHFDILLKDFMKD